MGYELHITRRDDWADEPGPAIELGEWTAVIEADPDLRLDGEATASTPDGPRLTYTSPGLAVWTTYSGHREGGTMAWFDHRAGEIVVKNPDPEIIAKMIAIAALLDARVQGDDGEFYDEPPSSDPEHRPDPAPEPERRGRWWRRR